MDYIDHEVYTHDQVTLLPAVKLAYNPRQHSTTDFHEIWKRAFDTASKCISDAKEYNKQRYHKTHREPDFKEGDQVLVSTLNFNSLKGPKEMRDSFLGPFTLIKLIGKNAVEVRITDEHSRKNLVFAMIFFKPYLQIGEDKFPSMSKT
ncbi:hypothetical protein O181_014043 [Austropuccinia psidii MF-1]|uniref:Uncharacterized protein n=1 Tax=Austropuccinia psidii MF-1 TaxID=1389203 RepID=A0A9Q3C0G6_9BASI|nr:hypothetical protein [Austropuccinia psidii MF-1]